MPRVVVAPDKFKGSLSAAAVARHLAAGLVVGRADVEAVCVPVADGGEGTVDAALSAGYERVSLDATGPTGEPVRTAYARRGTDAVIELALVSGLGLLPSRASAVPATSAVSATSAASAALAESSPAARIPATSAASAWSQAPDADPLRASSYGTGEVVRAALDAGCRKIVLGVGGSACTDGGAGLLQALGARLLDASGNDLAPGGAALASIDSLDLSGLHPRLASSELLVASDVDNPLYGEHGAAAVYGPQKGASPDQVALLDQALRRWASVVAGVAGLDDASRPGADAAAAPSAAGAAGAPGAGAAGGVGFGAVAVLGASLRSGIDLVLDLVGLDSALRGASLVITGEGSLDRQSLHGKAPAGVARAARRAGVPVLAVAGRSLLPATELGFEAVYALTDLEPDVRRSMAAAGQLLERVGTTVAEEHLAGNASYRLRGRAS